MLLMQGSLDNRLASRRDQRVQVPYSLGSDTHQGLDIAERIMSTGRQRVHQRVLVRHASLQWHIGREGHFEVELDCGPIWQLEASQKRALTCHIKNNGNYSGRLKVADPRQRKHNRLTGDV